MIINYDIFYRRFGLRLVSQMLSPRFGRLGNFQLPRGAILHSAHGDTTKLGPVESELAFRGVLTELLTNGDVKARSVARPIMVEHVMQMTDPIGRPIRANVIVNNLIRTYHQQHRRFRRITKIETALKDPNTMVVYNYDLLPHLYRYPRTFFNQYFEWSNIEHKLWEEVAKCAVESDRPQFIIRNIPKILPARSSFQQAAVMNTAQPSRRVLKLFDTPEHLFLIELWKWLGKDRQSSMLAAIPRDKLRRVNIIFQESGSWIAVNLGVLDSWREPNEDERFENEPVRTNLFTPDRFQIRALRFLMSIQQLRSESDPEITAMADQVLDSDDAEAIQQEYEMLVHKVEDRAAVKDALSGVIRVAETTQRAMNIPQKIDEPEDTADSVKINEKTEEQIDADIAALEKLQAAHLEEVQVNDAADAEITREDPHSNSFAKIAKAVDAVPVITPLPTLKPLALDEALMAICNQRADEGTMSAAQYRHYQTISKAYKTIVAPDGKSTLEQYIAIPPEKLQIAASKTIPDIATVSDKSMLKSSLLEFDERYIKDVLSRDVASMIMSVQNAGIAITTYNVETVDQVMGSFEMHSVRMVPVEGTASTLYFKLPVVEEDGSYTANGVKYRLRKQRGDLPIRKVKPDTVALTSYYGKVFVRRSEKKVNDWGNWLRNNIMAKWQEPTDHTVINAHPGDVSDNLFKSPRLYSALAKGFRTFMLQSSNLPDEFVNTIFTMSFDHTKREKLYGADAIRQYEQNGAIIAGVGGVNEDTYFLIGRHSTVAIAKDSRIVQVPSIEGVLGLDRYNAPVDFAVMKVSGESIPLGVILGYVMGLDNLIGLLNAKVRRVPAGKRLMLETHESAIVFNDESIIMDKNDQLACMFLGGFKEYHRILKRFNSHLFNKRDVYLNLLEAAGMGVRYLREIDLFFQMFVDPITRDLLIEMKEPTDVRGLLLRAGSMLINDDHPDELDAAWMRIKGYERMAGAVYTELVRSIRSHNGAPGKARSGLDLNPYTIWTNIQTDPSKAMVMDINPIQNLREKEAVTYSGTGGRNSRTMTKHTREYHRNDMGTISGDTVDSSDVAINTYTSADPQFTSLRGISRRYDDGVTMGATTLLSSSALVSVGSDHDD